MARVRAVVFTGDGKYDVRELPEPEPPPGGAVLRVEAVGMCGSDLSQLDGHPQVPGQKFPVVPGHETVGRIEKLAPGVGRVWGVGEGDRVAVDEVLLCGTCPACRRGEPGCHDLQVYGYTMGLEEGSGLWGGFGEKMALRPGTQLHRLPDDVPADELTLFEPLASAVNWVGIAGVRVGDTVVVQGPGHQGLACVVAARAAGATQTIVTGTGADTLRLDAARAIGADHTIDVEAEDPIVRVRELTGGRMADVVMDVAAVSTATVSLSLELARWGGRILLAGLKHFRPVENFVSDLLVVKSLSVFGGAGPTRASVRCAVDLLRAGRVPTRELRGEVFTLDQFDQAMDLLARRVPGRDAVRVGLRHLSKYHKVLDT